MPDLTESNTGKVNDPGWYKDLQSGVVQHVSNPAAADALVRLGWKQLEPGPNPVTDPKATLAFEQKHRGATTLVEAPVVPETVEAPAEPETPVESATEPVESAIEGEATEVGETTTPEGEDSYKVTDLSDGSKRYFKNGARISQADYDAATGTTE